MQLSDATISLYGSLFRVADIIHYCCLLICTLLKILTKQSMHENVCMYKTEGSF